MVADIPRHGNYFGKVNISSKEWRGDSLAFVLRPAMRQSRRHFFGGAGDGIPRRGDVLSGAGRRMARAQQRRHANQCEYSQSDPKMVAHGNWPPFLRSDSSPQGVRTGDAIKADSAPSGIGPDQVLLE